MKASVLRTVHFKDSINQKWQGVTESDWFFSLPAKLDVLFLCYYISDLFWNSSRLGVEAYLWRQDDKEPVECYILGGAHASAVPAMVRRESGRALPDWSQRIRWRKGCWKQLPSCAPSSACWMTIIRAQDRQAADTTSAATSPTGSFLSRFLERSGFQAATIFSWVIGLNRFRD